MSLGAEKIPRGGTGSPVREFRMKSSTAQLREAGENS